MKVFKVIFWQLLGIVLVFCWLSLYRKDVGEVFIFNLPKRENASISLKGIETLGLDKLEELVKTGYWNHTNEDGCDFHCRTRDYTREGKYKWIGENLYKGVCDVSNAYRLWEESPSHKAILEHEFNEEFLIMEEYEEGKCYIVLERGILR